MYELACSTYPSIALVVPIVSARNMLCNGWVQTHVAFSPKLANQKEGERKTRYDSPASSPSCAKGQPRCCRLALHVPGWSMACLMIMPDGPPALKEKEV